MDRLEAMTAFAMTVESGSLSAAARRLGRSAASITRAIASLEDSLGVTLLQRTTRSLRLTEAGERYLTVVRRVLGDLAEAEVVARGALEAPRGLVTITAPVSFGVRHVREIVNVYLAKYADVRARLLLLDRVVHLVDEGIDVAIRIAHMPDSALVATRLGEVHRIVCASPKYLARHGRPVAPADLGEHRCISFSSLTPSDTWSFGGGRHGGRARHSRVHPSLTVNSADAAIASAIDGHGIVCVLSYQVAEALAEARLERVLGAFEPDPLPVHLVCPSSSLASGKVRAFVDLAVPVLRASLLPHHKGASRRRR